MTQTLQKLINSYFPATSQEDTQSIDEIREAVRLRIGELLNRDMQSLLQILYRIDVDEERVKSILALSEPYKVDADLADAVVERVLQKAAFRDKYKD